METTTISQYELERGKPVPRFKHSRVQSNLIVALSTHQNQYDVLPELDVVLNGKPFVPDICVYPKGTPNWTGEEEPFREPPLIAIEIISPSQSLEHLLTRASEYLTAGAGAAWVVVPAVQTVYVMNAPNAKPRAFTDGTIKDERTGIEVNTKDVFR
jgi:Uma2 family endonuclease